jgi:cell division protein FtsI (penicillin-binding protein 3)
MTDEAGQARGTVGGAVHRRRLRVLVGVWALVGLACLARAGYLQLVEGDQWRKLARAQNAAREEVPAARGGIYDRSGTALALSSHEFRAYLAPRETPNPHQAVEAIGRVLGLSAAEERRLRSRDRGWVALPEIVSVEERDRLQRAVRRGLHFKRLTSRIFPQGPLARPILGSLGSEGDGHSGIELALDSLLAGEPGAALTRRDALGGQYRLPDGQIARPRPGHDVRLTLDAELQRIAEDALEAALRETGASGGDVLMLDPRTGEILAAASRRVDRGSGMPAFTDPYEPGSTLKPFLLASLLEEEEARLAERVDTGDGELRQHGRVIRDVHPEDTLSVADVVRFSSNVGAARLAERLSPGLQYRYLRDFGFGTPVGIEYPSESGGLLRRPSEWSALSQASLAMGYEISVTSLQLAAAYGALANGGVLMRPYLVREIRSPSGEVVERTRPESIRRVVSPETAGKVTRVLSRVVEDGTATRAALATLPVAGKTGTARVATRAGYEDGRYAASFVGYTPVDDPRLVVVTKLNDPQGSFYGGQTAAPLSRSTIQAALATRGVSLPGSGYDAGEAPARMRWGRAAEVRRDEGPFVFAVDGAAASSSGGGRARSAEAGRRTLPDLRGVPLRTAAARLHQLGLRVSVRGSGRVRAQEPGPGATVESGSTVVLR